MFSIVATFIYMAIFAYQMTWGSKDPIEHATNVIIFWIIVCSNLVLTGLYDKKRN